MKYLFMLLFLCSCAHVNSTGNFFGTSDSSFQAGNAANDAANAAATHQHHHQPMMMP